MIELIQGVLGAFPYAEAAAGEAEGAGLSFNLFWILISAANFGFFIIVLRAAALGPITKMLDERRERIERGQVIGALGNTGRSTGPHLPYEVVYQGQAMHPVKAFAAWARPHWQP